jgi:hypothetical protein
MRIALLLLLLLNLSHESLSAAPPTDSIPVETVRTLVSQGNIPALKKLGTGVLPVMVQLYRAANESDRVNIAEAFYGLDRSTPITHPLTATCERSERC